MIDRAKATVQERQGANDEAGDVASNTALVRRGGQVLQAQRQTGGTAMTANGWTVVLGLVWTLLVAAGFAHASYGTPTGGGFVHGMNLLLAFVVWQAAAVLLGAGRFWHWLARRDRLAIWARVLGLVPPVVSLAAVLVVVVWLG